MADDVPLPAVSGQTAGRDLTLTINQFITRFGEGAWIDHGEQLKDLFTEALRAELPLLARAQEHRPQEASVDATTGIFIKAGERAAAQDAALNAIAALAADDVVFRFGMDPHINALSEFLASTPEFFAVSQRARIPLTLPKLPVALKQWARSVGHTGKASDAAYLQAVAHMLVCSYAEALRLVEPVARMGQVPLHCELAAECALNVGQYSVALRHLQEVLLQFPNAPEPGSEQALRLALLRSNLGACHEGVLESETAIHTYRLALADLPGDDCDQLAALIRAKLLSNLGFSLMTLSDESPGDGNLAEAEACFQAALKLREDEGDTEANKALVLFNLAEVRRKVDDAGAAADFLDRAAGVLDRLVAPHLLKASVKNAQGLARFDDGRYADALECFQAARRTLAQLTNEHSERYVLTTYSIAQTLEAMGDPKAREHLLRARTLALSTFDSSDHPIIAMIVEDLA